MLFAIVLLSTRGVATFGHQPEQLHCQLTLHGDVHFARRAQL
jgi:hypothetical protein